jgi:AraC-like DNA-binding protein
MGLSMQFEWVNIVQIAIASPAIFTAVVLARRSNLRALAALLAVFGVHMAFNVAEETQLLKSGLLITPALSLLYGPLFYLLIRGLIFHDKPLGRRDIVHFMPFVLALFVMQWLGVVRLATIISLVGYGIACVRNIWVYHRATQTQRSDAMALRLNWVIAVFAGFGGLTILDVVRLLTTEFQSAGFRQAAYALSLSSVAALFGVLAYYAINRPTFFAGLTDEQFRFAPEAAGDKAVTSADTAKFAAIESTIKQEQLFLQPHLTLSNLANRTVETERELSRLINLIGKRNFCDYINALRVEEAARLLADERGATQTILEIAFEAGFTSKSSFNAVFKREMGATPSEYRRRALPQPKNEGPTGPNS